MQFGFIWANGANSSDSLAFLLQVRNCQQSLCIAHFEMEKSLDKTVTVDGHSSTADDQFRHFDNLSGRLTALNDAIKNLHPHQHPDTTEQQSGSRASNKFR